MSALNGEQLTKLRCTRHDSDMYLAVLVPEDVFKATVTNNEARGATTIEYTFVSGDDDNTYPGMIAWFGTSAGGKEIGVARIRSIDTGATQLVIEENDLDLAVGNTITVKRVFLPRSRLPNIDVSGATPVFTKDSQSYNDEGLHIPPVVVMGPPACAWVNEDDGYATVKFVDQYSWSPCGATLSTKVWGWDGGAEQGGTGTLADPFVIAYTDPGVYWVALTITDSNSEVSTGWRPVFIFDAENLPYIDFTAGSRHSTLQGTRQSFEVVGDADQTHFPDGAWVVRFNSDYYDSTLYEMDTRYPFRGNVKFVGFLDGDTLRTDTQTWSTSFEAVDITETLNRLPGFGDTVEWNASPNSWVQIANLDVIKAVHHVLRWSTTVLEIADWRYSIERSASEIKIQKQRWGAGSVLQQCEYVLSEHGIFASLCATVQGCLWIKQDPCLVDPTARGAYVTLCADLARSDYANLQVQRRESAALQHVRLSGLAFDGSAITPYASRAPGVPDEATQPEDASGQVLVDQTDTNRLSGDLFAKLNNPIISAALELPGNWDVFDPALQERITFPILATENNRGLVYSSSNYWIPREMTVDEDIAGGFMRGVTLVLERETTGTPGVTVVVPGQPIPGATEQPSSIGPYGQIVVTDLTHGVAYTNHIEYSSPVWKQHAAGAAIDWNVDRPTSAQVVRVSSGVDSLFLTTDAGAILEYTPLPFPNGKWYRRQAVADLLTLVSAPGGYDGECYSLIYDPADGDSQWAILSLVKALSAAYRYVLHTTDAWDTVDWARSCMDDCSLGWDTHAESDDVQLCIGPYSGGTTLYVTGLYKNDGGGLKIGLRQSTDSAANWASVLDGFYNMYVAVPVETGDDSRVFTCGLALADGNPAHYYSTDSAANFATMGADDPDGSSPFFFAYGSDDRCIASDNSAMYTWTEADGWVVFQSLPSVMGGWMPLAAAGDAVTDILGGTSSATYSRVAWITTGVINARQGDIYSKLAFGVPTHFAFRYWDEL
jgi:hypothetical protein